MLEVREGDGGGGKVSSVRRGKTNHVGLYTWRFRIEIVSLPSALEASRTSRISLPGRTMSTLGNVPADDWLATVSSARSPGEVRQQRYEEGDLSSLKS